MANGKPTGPPMHLVASAALIQLVAVTLFTPLAGPTSNLVGFFVGSVLGIANLAVFLVEDNKRRASGMYEDKTPSPRRFLPWLALTSWAVGACHIFFWALELTR